VLNAVGTAATAMRAKLGESRNSIQKLNLPLEQATTSSLDALQNYTIGKAVLTQGRFLAAVPLFERAIAIDPNFVAAYYYLSIAYNNAGDAVLDVQYKRKAFAFIDRVSEFERTALQTATTSQPVSWTRPLTLLVLASGTIRARGVSITS
jgi:tetratricopeptide (TPR) repeat protein